MRNKEYKKWHLVGFSYPHWVLLCLPGSSAMSGCLYPLEHIWTDFQDVWYRPVSLQSLQSFWTFELCDKSDSSKGHFVQRITKCLHVARYVAHLSYRVWSRKKCKRKGDWRHRRVLVYSPGFGAKYFNFRWDKRRISEKTWVEISA